MFFEQEAKVEADVEDEAASLSNVVLLLELAVAAVVHVKALLTSHINTGGDGSEAVDITDVAEFESEAGEATVEARKFATPSPAPRSLMFGEEEITAPLLGSFCTWAFCGCCCSRNSFWRLFSTMLCVRRLGVAKSATLELASRRLFQGLDMAFVLGLLRMFFSLTSNAQAIAVIIGEIKERNASPPITTN